MGKRRGKCTMIASKKEKRGRRRKPCLYTTISLGIEHDFYRSRANKQLYPLASNMLSIVVVLIYKNIPWHRTCFLLQPCLYTTISHGIAHAFYRSHANIQTYRLASHIVSIAVCLLLSDEGRQLDPVLLPFGTVPLLAYLT